MRESTNKTMCMVGCIMVIMSLSIFIHTEKDWLNYLVNREKVQIISAKVVDIISGKTYRDTSYYTEISYLEKNKTIYHVILSDYRDFHESTILVGVLPTGEVVRTKFIICPNMFMELFLVIFLFLLGLLAIVKAIRGRSIINGEIRVLLNKEIMSDIDSQTGQIIGIALAVITVLIGVLVIVLSCLQ